MYKIIDKRGTGKTRKLMELVKENDGILVCKNPAAMEVKAHNYGIFGIDIISYQGLIRTIVNNNTFVSPVYIDEIDSFNKCLLNSIQGYTLSIEE